MKWRICCMICHIQVKSLFYNGFNIAKYTPTYIFCGVLSVVSWQHLDDYLYTYFICCFSFVAFCLFRKKKRERRKNRQTNQRTTPHHEARIKEKALVDFLREMKEVRVEVRWDRSWKLGLGLDQVPRWDRDVNKCHPFFFGGRTHKNDDFEGFFRFA